jgi:hypothetical protein
MSLILSGSDGLSDVDGSAATPAIRGTDTNTGIFFPAADTIAFSEGGTEAMRITSAGRLGVGTTAPAYQLEVKAGSTYVGLNSDGTNGVVESNGALFVRTNTANPLVLGTNTTERMRIDSSGNLCVGTTSSNWATNGHIESISGYACKAGQLGAFSGNGFNINWTGSPQLWIDATNIGTIAFTSDYRVKRNVETQTAPALERVMALRPVTYQMADYGDLFKAGDDIKEGFIAHEVQEVIPSGAEGVKDDETQIQSLRVDAILAVAVKAIQEFKAELDTVKAELAALKA